jgi:hypothetical protein
MHGCDDFKLVLLLMGNAKGREEVPKKSELYRKRFCGSRMKKFGFNGVYMGIYLPW